MTRHPDYQDHLNKVSRSFAFCIAELQQPLRSWVGLSYILFRIVDTIEDSAWSDRGTQLKSMEQVKVFAKNASGNFAQWRSLLPSGIEAAELDLLRESENFFSDLGSSPPRVRGVITQVLVQMVDGMSHFLSVTSPQKKLVLQSLSEVNQYCFFVAGIVGELLSELVLINSGKIVPTREFWTDSIHFGLFLQKVNLLKDQMRDETEGRFLVPSREEFKQSLRENAEGAFRYLTKIPIELSDYRLFCAWSLFLGLASLKWIDRAWQEKRDLKIPRTETMALLARIKFSISEPQKLSSLFQELGALSSSPITKDRAQADLPAWFTKAYSGRVHIDELITLELV